VWAVLSRTFSDGESQAEVAALAPLPPVKVKSSDNVARVGPDCVHLAFFGNSNGATLRDDAAFVHNGSAFVTVRGNVCVLAGKWMYEVMLGSSGMLQIGWFCEQDLKPNAQDGIGDFANSYAYDGDRVRRWSISYDEYGQRWTSGDVIGCCIDLDAGQVSYARNGVPLGVAFNDIRRDSGMAFFPGTSLAGSQQCLFNFGRWPLLYPSCLTCSMMTI